MPGGENPHSSRQDGASAGALLSSLSVEFRRKPGEIEENLSYIAKLLEIKDLLAEDSQCELVIQVILYQ